MNDLISIIVYVYNNEKTVRDCIISLIGQTYRNLEIILIDDGSSDASAQICDDLILTSSKMKVVHRMHVGIGDSRNFALDIATGKYVTFVNASDIINRELVEDLYQMMFSYPVDISICSSNSNSNAKNGIDTIITLNPEDALRQLLLEKNIKNTVCGKLFKTELFKTVNFTDDNANVLSKLFETSKKIAFNNNSCYLSNTLETYSRNTIINRNIRIMKFYPSLELYCKYNTLKNIQDEFYDCICNNKPLINEDNMYKMFCSILKDKEDKVAQFFSYNRKAHMYLMADNLDNYKRLCPVLPDIILD